MAVKRMDNVGIVVEDIDAAIEFFTELGLELKGRAPVEGDWADRVTGLRDMRVEIAMMRTPDGHGRLEMSRFLAPPVVADHRSATAPEPSSSRPMSFKSTCAYSPANNVGPWPASLGCTTNSYSSINPSSANASGSFTPPVASPLTGSCLSC